MTTTAQHWTSADLERVAPVVERGGDSNDLHVVLTSETPEFLARRVRARKLMREFLRFVPREDVEATITFVRPDGVTRTTTRAALSAAIDQQMRPRIRQILQLGVEARWPRAKVCAHMHDISLKTYERDQVEGLDILLAL